VETFLQQLGIVLSPTLSPTVSNIMADGEIAAG
jgi:hypothetical protein